MDNQQVTKNNNIHARLPLVDLLRNVSRERESLRVRTIQFAHSWSRSNFFW